MFFKPSHSAVLAALFGVSTHSFAADPSHLEHPHGAGTTMVELSYMRMAMDGLQQGGNTVTGLIGTTPNQDYMMEPTTMSMDMIMLMPMYNITRELSVMLMANYLINTMEMKTNSTTLENQTMQTYGFGDTEIDVSYKFFEDSFAASLALSVPTGSITETNSMTMLMYHQSMGHQMNMTMPMRSTYMMQLGSGTYDVTPSLTYLGAYYSLRYGAQVSYTYRIGENSEGYTLGDKAKALTWVRKPVGFVVLDAQLAYTRWGDIEGSDPNIDQTMQFTSTTSLKTSTDAYTSNYGGSRVDASLGAKFPIGPASLGFTFGMPVYQKLNGIQMPITWSLSSSVSVMF